MLEIALLFSVTVVVGVSVYNMLAAAARRILCAF
jgi:hypothetical protein